MYICFPLKTTEPKANLISASKTKANQKPSYPMLSSGIPCHESLVFSSYTHKPLGECVCKGNTSDEWDVLWYTTRNPCIIGAVHDGKVGCDTVELHCSMGRFGGIPTNIQQLSCILIGCIFYGMV